MVFMGGLFWRPTPKQPPIFTHWMGEMHEHAIALMYALLYH
jgi:hypothetical protein